jgi:putative transposase
MTYNPKIHHRKSIRLKGYDYSQAGLYFITIAVQDRLCLFGKITESPVGADLCVCPELCVCPYQPEMILNDAGKMIAQWYLELPNKFPDIELGEYIVMPNHFHAIIINNGMRYLRVCSKQTGEHIEGEHTGSPLHTVVQWFKTMTTNEYIRGVKQLNWQRFNGKLWQRNYYEHIIRNEESHNTIANYIINNPAKWQEDKLYQNIYM